MILKFDVPGEPRGKGRPRFARAGRFVKTYTPAETAAYESTIRLFFQTAYPKHEPITGPIVLRLEALFSVPASTSRKRAMLMIDEKIRPTKRPDLDNCIKAALDALNGIAFKDDAQIVAISASKFYAVRPTLKIEIEEMEET